MKRWTFIFASAVVLGMMAPAAVALEPEEVVVLFNPRSPNSERVAQYYMTARRIPRNHLMPLICEPGDNVTEAIYRESLVPQVRRGLEERRLTGRVKCLVTTFDLPFRVGTKVPAPLERQELDGYHKQLDQALTALEAQIAGYDAVAPAPGAPPVATQPGAAATQGVAETAGAPQPRTWQALVPRLNAAASGAARRVDALPGAARGPAMAQFLAVHEKVTGPVGLLGVLRVPDDAPQAEDGRRRLREITAALQTMEGQAQQALRRIGTVEGRKALVEVRGKSGGLLSQVRTIEEVSSYLKAENTESCLDNELALVLWEEAYPRANWIMNPLNVETYHTVQRLPGPAVPRTLMVARLDGLTPEAVEAMILQGLKVEAAGLEGNFYLDARGLHGTDAYAAYDADIRKTAEWMKVNATIETVLDDKPELIAAKDAPAAAVYCGWYSLRNYQESGQWVRGAVGYHVASHEMDTLHDPKERGWVTNLLARGFCGTMGATDEPYLTSFPKPSLFFPLLLSGQFTQGEAWQVTAPMLSWRVGFVGDPLYNPFKVKPRVREATLRAHPVLRNAYTILRAGAPGTGPATATRPG